LNGAADDRPHVYTASTSQLANYAGPSTEVYSSEVEGKSKSERTFLARMH